MGYGVVASIPSPVDSLRSHAAYEWDRPGRGVRVAKGCLLQGQAASFGAVAVMYTSRDCPPLTPPLLVAQGARAWLAYGVGEIPPCPAGSFAIAAQQLPRASR